MAAGALFSFSLPPHTQVHTNSRAHTHTHTHTHLIVSAVCFISQLAHDTLRFVRRIDAEQRARSGDSPTSMGTEFRMSSTLSDAVENVLIETLVAPMFAGLQLRTLTEAMQSLDFAKEDDWRYWASVLGSSGAVTSLPAPIESASDAIDSRNAFKAILAEFRLDDGVLDVVHEHNIAQQLLRHATASGHMRWALLLSAALDDTEAAVHILTHHPATFSVFDTLGKSVGSAAHRDFIEALRAEFCFLPPAGSPKVTARRVLSKQRTSRSAEARVKAAREDESECSVQ